MLKGDTKCKTMGKLCGNSQSGRFIANESSLQRCKKILRLLADRSVDWHLSDKMIVCQNLHSSTHVSHTIVVLFSFLWTPGLTIYIINDNSHWNHSVFWGFFGLTGQYTQPCLCFYPRFLHWVFLLCSCFTVSFLIRCFNVYCFALRGFVYKKGSFELKCTLGTAYKAMVLLTLRTADCSTASVGDTTKYNFLICCLCLRNKYAGSHLQRGKGSEPKCVYVMVLVCNYCYLKDFVCFGRV